MLRISLLSALLLLSSAPALAGGTAPGSGEELCNGEDDDRDGVVDEDAADATAWYLDEDLDGYGDDDTEVLSCARPEPGYVPVGGDCDDADPSIYTGAPELCDLVDNNCNGTVDDGAPGESTFYADADGDGYGDAAATYAGCGAPSGYVSDGSDCDDADGTTFPGASEACDSVDNDCDGVVDVGCEGGEGSGEEEVVGVHPKGACSGRGAGVTYSLLLPLLLLPLRRRR